jgi:hypothetical protein
MVGLDARTTMDSPTESARWMGPHSTLSMATLAAELRTAQITQRLERYGAPTGALDPAIWI